MNAIDNLERAVENRLSRADCCIRCGKLIPSQRQIENRKVETCGRPECQADMHEEER